MSIRAVITGGVGFLGDLLARRLLNGPFGLGGGPSADVGELVLADLAGPRADLPADPECVP